MNTPAMVRVRAVIVLPDSKRIRLDMICGGRTVADSIVDSLYPERLAVFTMITRPKDKSAQ